MWQRSCNSAVIPEATHHTNTPVSTGLKNPWRMWLSGNWTLRTTWRQETAANANALMFAHLHKDGPIVVLIGLTLGYLSIFSFICASLKAFVISGASSNNFLQMLGKRRGNIAVRNKPLTERTPQIKRGEENIQSQLLCGRERVTAAAVLISPFVITVIDRVVAQLWGGRLSQHRQRLQDGCCEMCLIWHRLRTRSHDPIFRSFSSLCSF